MTFGLLLSALFFILDWTGKVDWTWWQILLPSFIELGLSLLVFILWITIIGSISKGMR